MHLLLTNDDGINAPGLAALHAALREKHTLSIVAPTSEQSRTGHTANYDQPITVHAINHETLGPSHSVNGTPVDCARLAVTELVTEPVDVVISGINHGANVGWVDLATSGTFAAARDLAFLDIPAIAISQMFLKNQPTDWPAAFRRARTILDHLLDASAPPVKLWNVNLPRTGPGQQPKGVRLLPPSFDQIPLQYETLEKKDSLTTYQYAGEWESRTRTPDHDVAGVFDGYVVVTPLDAALHVAQNIPDEFVRTLEIAIKNSEP